MNTHRAAASCSREIGSDSFFGGDGKGSPGVTVSAGFSTAARPTDFIGDMVSTVHSSKHSL